MGLKRKSCYGPGCKFVWVYLISNEMRQKWQLIKVYFRQSVSLLLRESNTRCREREVCRAFISNIISTSGYARQRKDEIADSCLTPLLQLFVANTLVGLQLDTDKFPVKCEEHLCVTFMVYIIVIRWYRAIFHEKDDCYKLNKIHPMKRYSYY